VQRICEAKIYFLRAQQQDARAMICLSARRRILPERLSRDALLMREGGISSEAAFRGSRGARLYSTIMPIGALDVARP